MELAVILKTALGVTHLSVSRLFTAIDPEDTGKITFGRRCNSTITGHNTFLLILVFNVALLLFFFFFHGEQYILQPGLFNFKCNPIAGLYLACCLIWTVSLAPSCGLFTDRLRCFAEQQPDFAETFLYTENAGLHSGSSHGHQTKPSLSSQSLRGTATTKTANGICPDFSPKDLGRTIGVKKLN